MEIKIGYEMVFDVATPTPMILQLYVHPERIADLQQPQRLCVEPAIPLEEFSDAFGNPAVRLVAPAGTLRLYYDNIINDTGQPEAAFFEAIQHPVEDLPYDTLQFLLGSRYCEVDELSDIAWKLFSNTPQGWGRVQAICDWVEANVEFGYKYARPTKTAFDVYKERQGVCRDLNHLAVTFCRCMNIPARYATGYLGDIGVPVDPNPGDFSAFFEAYLGGQWHPFDARHNTRRVGRVKMAAGRDAADVALTTSFGFETLKKFVVWTDEIKTDVPGGDQTS